MDELYTESFFHTAAEKTAVVEKRSPEVKQEVLLANPQVETLAETYEFSHSFHFHLDKLEKAIFDQLGAIPLFRLEFETLRKTASSSNNEELYRLLDRLERFVDLASKEKEQE